MATFMLRRSCSHTSGMLGGRCLTAALGRPTAGVAAAAPRSCQPLRLGNRSLTTVFNVKPRPGQTGAEQTLFVIGLNEGKFFGQDGAEEALKLLERIAEQPQGSQYNLLFSLSEREMTELEADFKVKHNRLTPSRELEGVRFNELVPVLQASMVDRRPRRALGRVIKICQGHVSWQLWRHPREAVKVYWAYWRRKDYKDAARRKFWMEHFPICAYAHFMEVSQLLAVRSTSLMVAAFGQEKPTTWVLVVSNTFFEPTVEHLAKLLDSSAPVKFEAADFSRHLRETTSELTIDAPDFTPLLIFFYVALPVLLIQTGLLGIQRLWTKSGVYEMVLPSEHRD